jgi:hypothetical protein
MKRYFVPFMIITFSLALQACQAGSPAADTPTPLPPAIETTQSLPTPEVFLPLNACDNFFLPLTGGTTWSFSDGSALSVGPFEGNDAEGSTFAVRKNPDGTLEKLFILCKNGKTEIVKIATLDKDLNETGSKSMSEISNGACESKVILPESENLVPGKIWQQCETNCRVITDQTISIQLGTFKTRRVECEDGTVRWYAPQFGLVKSCTGKTCSELIQMQAPD